MAAVHDLIIRGDHPTGRSAVARALEAQGYRVTDSTHGELHARRGSLVSTLLMGAAAGTARSSLSVSFSTDQQGRLVASVRNRPWGSVLDGSAVGLGDAHGVLRQSVDLIARTLHDAGRLDDVVVREYEEPASRLGIALAGSEAGPYSSAQTGVDEPLRRPGWPGLICAVVFTVVAMLFTLLAVLSGALAAVTRDSGMTLVATLAAAGFVFRGVWGFPPRTYRVRIVVVLGFAAVLAIVLCLVIDHYESVLHS